MCHFHYNCKPVTLTSIGRSKSHATHSWRVSHLSKNRLHWNQKTKNSFTLSFENVHRVQPFFPILYATRWRVLVAWKWFTRRDFTIVFLNSFWRVKIEMPGSFPQWKLVARPEMILAFPMLKYNWRSGESKLEHEITCIGSCIVTAILCVY